MERKEPKPTTIKALFAKSGNQCAFPECNHSLIDDRNLFVAEVCHINSVKKKDARYNPTLTVEQLRDYDNLILMCHAHHKRIDTFETEYSVETLKKMRSEHEALFIGQNFQVPESVVEDSMIQFVLDDSWEIYLEQLIEYLEQELEEARGGQQGMNLLSTHIGAVLDAQVTIYYMRLLSALRGTERRELFEAQESWVKRRQEESSASVESHGGSLAPLEFGLTYIDITRDRLNELKNRVNAESII